MLGGRLGEEDPHAHPLSFVERVDVQHSWPQRRALLVPGSVSRRGGHMTVVQRHERPEVGSARAGGGPTGWIGGFLTIDFLLVE
jgi:hypothetical protein